MPNEIYHRSNWGNANAEGFGDVYFDAAATNKLYNHSDYYENSDGTDKILRDLPNKASIALTPTAYSDGSLNTVIPPYQVLPTELVTNGDFATDSDWTKETGWTISGGKANKEGATASNFYQPVFTSGKKYRLTFDISNSNDGRLLIYFGGAVSEDILSASDGTYSFDNLANNDTLIFRNVNWTGSIDNVSVKEIQEADFDFSRGSSATRVNEKGLIESIASGLPRIDYTSGFGSLLLEPQSTNLVTYSEDFSQWIKSNSSVNTNLIQSPSGFLDADKIIENTNNSTHFVLPIVNNVPSSGIATLSVFAKKGENNWIKLVQYTNYANFDLENGVIGNSSAISSSIINYGSGWYKCIMNFNVAGGGANFDFKLGENNTSSWNDTYTGDGTSGVYLWGAQLEAGDYATSYIVSNSGSTTTRSADVANNSGNADLFNDSEGVLYAEISALADDGTGRNLGISDGTTSNRILILYSPNSNELRFYLEGSGGSITINHTLTEVLEFIKVAVKYKAQDFGFYVNGVEVDTNTSNITFSGLDDLSFNNPYGGGTSNFYGKTKELAVFKEALTDAELESLTSWVSFTEMATDLEYTLE